MLDISERTVLIFGLTTLRYSQIIDWWVVAAAEYCSGLDVTVTTIPAQLLGTGSALKSEDRDRGSSSTDSASEFPMLERKLTCSTELTLA
jgi:hypothetical protein